MATYPSQSVPTLSQLINPTYKQREFIAAFFDHDYTLYGGAAGGGKSYILRWVLVLYLMWLFREKGLRHVQVGLFCEDYPSLLDRHISKMRFEFPAQLGRLTEGTVKNFTLADEFGGGVLALRNLDDPSKYLSAEFAAIAVDELTKNGMETFDFLRSRCRWPGVLRPKFCAATNPGGDGHAWVKKLWVAHDFSEFPYLEPVKDQFAFVQARAIDNPYLPESYFEKLKTLPPDMAKAYAEGDWNLFAGQYFDIFSSTPGGRHVANACDIELQPWWYRWISGDWGYAHPACVHFHAQSGQRTITYKEIHGAGIGEADLAHRIIEMAGNEKFNAFYFSPDAFAKRGEANSVAIQMGGILQAAGLPYPIPAATDRVGGARLLHGMLRNNQWTISTACKRLIECLPQLIHDPLELEDVQKVDAGSGQLGDDPYDSARYGVYSHLGPKTRPREYAVREEAAKITDPFARWNFLRAQLPKSKESARFTPNIQMPWETGR